MEDDIADALTVQSTFLEGKCAMFGIFSQLRLAMDTETYPHDFTTALIPFPVPSEDYAEFYTQDQSRPLSTVVRNRYGCDSGLC